MEQANNTLLTFVSIALIIWMALVINGQSQNINHLNKHIHQLTIENLRKK